MRQSCPRCPRRRQWPPARCWRATQGWIARDVWALACGATAPRARTATSGIRSRSCNKLRQLPFFFFFFFFIAFFSLSLDTHISVLNYFVFDISYKSRFFFSFIFFIELSWSDILYCDDCVVKRSTLVMWYQTTLALEKGNTKACIIILGVDHGSVSLLSLIRLGNKCQHLVFFF